jgi:hypothetical protein
MASAIGQAPKQAKESNSVMPYVTSLATPVVTGALAGVGAKAGTSTLKGLARQGNELFNPLAGVSKSSLDWGKWNKEIPLDKPLMKEYAEIEQKAKVNGSWMKYSDGTPFTGTPEQFVQMKHKNTIDFAGGTLKQSEEMYKADLHRGAKQHIQDFKNREGGKDIATFLTDSRKNSESYAIPDGKHKPYYHPDINTADKLDDWEEGIYQLGIPQNTPKVVGDAKGRKWKLVDYDKKIAENIGSNAKEHNEYLKNNRTKDTYQDVETDAQYDSSKKYLSTDNYATYIKRNKEPVAQINNVKDQMGFATDIPANTVYAVDATRVPIKSLRYNNGKMNINNPNIYKAIVPAVVAGKIAKDKYNKDKKPSQ